MKIIPVIVSAILIIFSGLSGGCAGQIVGSGNLESANYDYTGFTMIEAESGFELIITREHSYSVEITADDNVQELLEITLAGNTLKIGLSHGSFSSITLKAEITMPEIEGIKLSGGARAAVTGFNSTKPFSATLTEGSVLTGDIVSGDAGFGLSGGSTVTLRGSGGDLMVRSSGGSEMTLDDFPVNNADINIDGGGKSFFNIQGRLDTVLTGGSELYYTGEPEMGDVNISGGSSLEKR